MLVGEIGCSRDECLYKLRYWEIVSIIRGYFRRSHSMWESTRMLVFCVTKLLGGAQNANTPSEFLRFSWEDEPSEHQPEITDDEYRRCQELIRKENERNNS